MSTQALDSPKAIGRPRKFTDVAALEAAIDIYFAAQDATEKPYTMAGLARTLGCDRSTLLRYEDSGYADEAFCRAVKAARQRVEEWVESRLLGGKGHPAGPIFSLKNNFGWRDEQHVTHKHEAVYTLRSRDDEVLFMPPVIDVTPLSPRREPVATLSPADSIAVSVENSEAKAPPIETFRCDDVA